MSDLSRRHFLGSTTAISAAWLAASQEPSAAAGATLQGEPPFVPRIAAINSVYRLRSHAYHIVGRFIHGYTRDGFHHQPVGKIVRMFNHQTPRDDLGKETCERHGIELCRSAAEALGGDRGLDVDAVLLIIEHGDYPLNERGQILYPRFELFEEITAAFRKSGRSVPVFCDKHLSYDFEKAARMIAASRELQFPMMAGSSLPVTWRMPELEFPRETPLREAVVTFGYDRSTAEVYLFHALEVLQCMVERRRGGETGVRAVRCLQGPAVWKALDDGAISRELVQTALDRAPGSNVGPMRENVKNPLAILLDYADGTRGAVLNLIEQTSDFAFAAHVEGQPRPLSTCFILPPPPGARFFNPLCWHIEQFFRTRAPTYPVERTWLTSTVLDLALRSLEQQAPRTDAALQIRYQPPATGGFFRGPYVDLA